KLEAELAKAMLSINAVKGFEIGSGFAGTKMRGSQHNDIILEGGKTKTNYSGGIQGGISNGMEIVFRTAFKPTSTIKKSQDSIDHSNQIVVLEVEGRHDPCVVPRAVPIVDALTALVLADMSLMNKTRRYQP
ncbi:MAG: chorismate synthase, partial [Chitinophagales bacterium]